MESGSRSIRTAAAAMVLAALLFFFSGVSVVWQLYLKQRRRISKLGPVCRRGNQQGGFAGKI
jgi:hypothetical protein